MKSDAPQIAAGLRTLRGFSPFPTASERWGCANHQRKVAFSKPLRADAVLGAQVVRPVVRGPFFRRGCKLWRSFLRVFSHPFPLRTHDVSCCCASTRALSSASSRTGSSTRTSPMPKSCNRTADGRLTPRSAAARRAKYTRNKIRSSGAVHLAEQRVQALQVVRPRRRLGEGRQLSVPPDFQSRARKQAYNKVIESPAAGFVRHLASWVFLRCSFL